MHICLIEDNSNDIELTTIALRKARIDVQMHSFKDGAIALEELCNRPFAFIRSLRLILLDLKLPKINGFEVLEALRSKPEFEAIPIVILTSSAVESDVVKAYSLGANSYIVKPIDYKEHGQAITQAVRYWTEINTLP